MKVLKKIFNYFKKSEESQQPSSLERFPFLKKSAEINKKMIEDENRRIELWSDQQLYEDVAIFIKKHFKDQNVELKKQIERLQNQVSSLKIENKNLNVENRILKAQEAIKSNSEHTRSITV